jgi:paraquat-inducible protein B
MTDKSKYRLFRPWWVWVVPLASLLFAGYLLFTFVEWGTFKATIAFEDVDGIEAGRTKIKYRGVTVGQITDVHLSTHAAVIAEAQLDDVLEPLVKEGATFWLIEPSIAFGQIQGMGTIFAGPYLDLQPGRGKKDNHFLGVSRPRLAGERFAGVTLRLYTPVNHALSVGNSVMYRGVRVGALTKIWLASDARSVEMDIKIEQAYAHLVRTNTVFWKQSGIQADVGILGAKINIPNFESMMSGTIAFATPDATRPIVKPGHAFPLAPAAQKEWLEWSPALKS